jgi:hypothetical protein
MSRHEDSVTLRQMLEHIEEAVSLACGRTREHLDSDRMFYLAVLKLVEDSGNRSIPSGDQIHTVRDRIDRVSFRCDRFQGSDRSVPGFLSQANEFLSIGSAIPVTGKRLPVDRFRDSSRRQTDSCR